jgi:hypothetical protein
LEDAAALDAAESLDTYAGRWEAAYIEIGSTMDAREFKEINAEITSHLRLVADGRCNQWDAAALSFVAARVESLVVRAANGFKVGLVMPPALSKAWREHDERHADSTAKARSKARFDSQMCADCFAEHPWLGRYEHSEALMRRVVVNPDELIKVCLLCGGVVGMHFPGGFFPADKICWPL